MHSAGKSMHSADTHCPYCALQCDMTLASGPDSLVVTPRPDFPAEARKQRRHPAPGHVGYGPVPFCMSSAAAANLKAFRIDRGLPFLLEDIAQTHNRTGFDRALRRFSGLAAILIGRRRCCARAAHARTRPGGPHCGTGTRLIAACFPRLCEGVPTTEQIRPSLVQARNARAAP